MKTHKDLEGAEISAIVFNITRQAYRENWVATLSAQSAEAKICLLLKNRQIVDNAFALAIMNKILKGNA